MIPVSPFGLIGIIRVRRPEFIFYMIIIGRMLVSVFYHDTNRSAGAPVLKYAGYYFYLVSFFALCYDIRLTGSPAIHLPLNEFR